MKLKSVSKGVYQGDDGQFYTRPTIAGKRTTRLMQSNTLAEAIKEAARGDHGHQRVPFDRLAADWLKAGCPGKDKQPRQQSFIDRATNTLNYPVSYFGHKDVAKIKPSEIADYGAWRSSKVKREGFTGFRAADIELATCAAMAWWAYFSDMIPANPFAIKFRFHKSKDVEHSPARAPASADVVHAIGEHLLKDTRTASCGFLWMFLALTGCRTGELRTLRLDGQPQGQWMPPGWHSDSEIVIRRGKRKDNGLDVLKLSDPAKDLLKAWKNWHAAKCAGSPIWFPGRSKARPMDVGSLCRAVKAACRKLGLPTTISPHGCRSFYCSVLRTIEPDDRKVADALGHSNVNMVQAIYGRRSSKTDGLTWLPTSGKPAWAVWSPQDGFAPVKPISI
jgi:integrase